jgi:endonuclease-3 related protein
MRRAKADAARGPAQRLRRMHDRLLAVYGPQHWWPAESAFEMVLGAYLTQNTSWKAVERSLANLRAAGALTIEGIRNLRIPQLQGLIRPSGFYTRKAPAIKAFVALLDTEFAGSLEVMATARTERLRERLLALPGVGYETADAILLYALGHPVPVGDEYLRRVVERHGLLKKPPRKDRKNYESLVELTREAFAEDPTGKLTHLFGEFHALIVAVGKAHCSKKANCLGCPLMGDPHKSLTADKAKIVRRMKLTAEGTAE